MSRNSSCRKISSVITPPSSPKLLRGRSRKVSRACVACQKTIQLRFAQPPVWFYQTKFDLEDTDEGADPDEEEVYFYLKLRIYYLAHKLGIDLMCKQLISWLNHCWDRINYSYIAGNFMEYRILPCLMQEICDNTSRNSGLRRMVLRRIAMFLFTSDRRGEEAAAREYYPLRNEIYRRFQEEVPSFASDLVDAILVRHSPSNALDRAQLLGKRKRPQEQ